jgi:hypothetical protein
MAVVGCRVAALRQALDHTDLDGRRELGQEFGNRAGCLGVSHLANELQRGALLRTGSCETFG